MAHQAVLIEDLRKQRDLLSKLILKLESKNGIGESDFDLYDLTTKQVERNLRKVRKTASEEVSKISRFKYQD